MTETHDTNLSTLDDKLEEDKREAVNATTEENVPTEVKEAKPEETQEITPVPNATVTPEVEQGSPEAEDELPDVIEKEEEIEKAHINFGTKQSCEEVIARLQEISADAENASKEELEVLKQTFYKIHHGQVELARKAFVEAGNDADAFTPDTTLEDEYKTLMSAIKEKRAEAQRQQDAVREQNLLRKEAILDQLKAMVENANLESASYNQFKSLQQQWKEITDVPAAKANELWKTYQQYTEKFYDILKLNIEFREYDFKKNLELKNRLCETAERLAEEPDVISAFHQLQKLHQEYREIGPVAKDLREEIWTRFKAASTVVNRRHQQHFEELKQNEQENLSKKTAICEQVESINYDLLTTYQQWNEKTQEIIGLQEQWKSIGFAPQKLNQKIFERFRVACDQFFLRKGQYFKEIKDNLSNNLAKKIALCERAEELKNTTDWKASSDKFVALQQEWKTIGPVSKKQSEVVWKRFIAACDYFFEQRNKANSDQRSEEAQNLAKKKEIITALTAIDPATATEEDVDKMHELIREWNATGHVPFKEKDRLYKQYRALIDNLFDSLHKNDAIRKVSNYKSSLKEGGTNINREREKLLRTYENMKNEIKTYENNIGFLTSSSKTGNSLVNEMMRKMDKLKADADLVLQKIKALEEANEPEA